MKVDLADAFGTVAYLAAFARRDGACLCKRLQTRGARASAGVWDVMLDEVMGQVLRKCSNTEGLAITCLRLSPSAEDAGDGSRPIRRHGQNRTEWRDVCAGFAADGMMPANRMFDEVRSASDATVVAA